jgi:hypothetical protein
MRSAYSVGKVVRLVDLARHVREADVLAVPREYTVVRHRVESGARAPAVTCLRRLVRGPHAAVARPTLGYHASLRQRRGRSIVERNAGIDGEGGEQVVLNVERVQDARHGEEGKERVAIARCIASYYPVSIAEAGILRRS